MSLILFILYLFFYILCPKVASSWICNYKTAKPILWHEEKQYCARLSKCVFDVCILGDIKKFPNNLMVMVLEHTKLDCFDIGIIILYWVGALPSFLVGSAQSGQLQFQFELRLWMRTQAAR